MARRYIYLVRHGQYDLSVADEMGGGLTAVGQQQAECAAQALSDQPVTVIHCSSLRRAEETAAIINQAFPTAELHRTKSLWECIPTVPPRFAEHFANHPRAALEKELSACQERLDGVFQTYFKPARGQDKHEILVCHGNVVRYLVARAMDVPPNTWANILIHNCGFSRVMVETDGQMFVVSHNEISHMPPRLRTET